jgi:hypothetical protein
VHDDVGAERQRVLVPRREERAVDHKRRLRCDRLDDLGDEANVDEPQRRVRRRLEPDELCGASAPAPASFHARRTLVCAVSLLFSVASTSSRSPPSSAKSVTTFCIVDATFVK